MTDIDAPFMEQVFHVAKRERKTNVVHHGQPNNLRVRFEIAKWAAFGHPTTLRNRPALLKRISSDKTVAWLGELQRSVPSRPGRAYIHDLPCSRRETLRQRPVALGLGIGCVPGAGSVRDADKDYRKAEQGKD
mgnify:CR=1 FL=1